MSRFLQFSLFMVLMAGAVAVGAQEGRIPLIGEGAPSFTAATTQGTVNFPADYAGKW